MPKSIPLAQVFWKRWLCLLSEAHASAFRDLLLQRQMPSRSIHPETSSFESTSEAAALQPTTSSLESSNKSAQESKREHFRQR